MSYKQIAIFYREYCYFAAVMYQLVWQMMVFFLTDWITATVRFFACSSKWRSRWDFLFDGSKWRLRWDFSPAAQNDGCSEIFRLRLKMTVAVSRLPRLSVGKSCNYGEKQKIRRKKQRICFANKYKLTALINPNKDSPPLAAGDRVGSPRPGDHKITAI